MRPIVTLLLLAGAAAAAHAQAAKKSPPAKSAASPNPAVLKAPVDVTRVFVASGYMGDGEKGNQYVQVRPVAGEKPRRGNASNMCIKVTYQRGSVNWAGVYWLHPANNWGDSPGFRIEEAKKITFWAAGEKGNEIVEFKAGGISAKPHKDSFEVTTGSIALTKEWKQYEISLAGQDLKSVVGAFAWVATTDANPKGLVFYLDAIRYE